MFILDISSEMGNSEEIIKLKGLKRMTGIEVRMNGKRGTGLFGSETEVRGKGGGVGPAITGARELVGISCEQLAEKIGIPTSKLEQIEAGKEDATPELLLKLAEGLKMKMELTFDMKPAVTMGVKFKK